MSLYPSLEDMKVDTMARAQLAQGVAAPRYQAPPPYALSPALASPSAPAHVYPALGEYMGLELSSDVIAQNMPEYRVQTVSIFWYRYFTLSLISTQSLVVGMPTMSSF